MANQANNRMRSTIPVSGLDTSTPDQSVADGKCEELHNLRFTGGAWRDVKPLQVLSELRAVGENDEPITPPEIIYRHPAAGEGHYIGAGYDTAGKRAYLYHLKTYPDGTISFNNDLYELRIDSLSADFRITHFGNILIVVDNGSESVHYFFHKEGIYERFYLPAPPVVKQSLRYMLDEDTNNPQSDYTLIWRAEPKIESVNKRPESKLFDRAQGLFHYEQVSSEKPRFFWGEICYFAAFQMSDGSLLCPSALNISSSEPFHSGPEGRSYDSSGSGLKYLDEAELLIYRDHVAVRTEHVALPDYGDNYSYYFATVLGINICPRIEITIPSDVNRDLIKYVNIYSTRINPIWDAEKLKNIVYPESGSRSDSDFARYYADNRLPEQPFYFVKSIPLSDFGAQTHTFRMYLSADLLKDVEQNAQYAPVDAHRIVNFTSEKEYNARLHIGQPALQLFGGYADTFFDPAAARPERYAIATEVEIDNAYYFLSTPSKIGFTDDYPLEPDPETVPWGPGNHRIRNRIVSYPDYRASRMYDMAKDAATASHQIDLTPALANNFAWAVCPDKFVKYSTDFTKAAAVSDRRIRLNDRLRQQNILRASAPNNPFTFPLANSYAFGTGENRILAVNAAALEMSDAKFGEFPLYVFTEEGIFTLQSGSGEVLYGATVPLNYDRIINPVTLAVNYNVLYITDRGLQALYSNQTTLLSEPINDADNLPRLDFLRTARICCQRKFDEVILYNPASDASGRALHPAAYVFSMPSKTWSTRDFPGYKLNTDEVVIRPGENIVRLLTLNEEASRPNEPVRTRMVTRPIKLGSFEYKRLETLIPRFAASQPQAMRLQVEGSTDLETWHLLRDTGSFEADRDTILRRFPSSMRYLRIALEASVSGDFAIRCFDLEYYLRFLHRLR